MWAGRGGTCPLLLNGSHVGLGELPGVRQPLPLMGAQVPGGQAPQNGAELPGLLPVVLLKGQALCSTVVGVPAGKVVLRR